MPSNYPDIRREYDLSSIFFKPISSSTSVAAGPSDDHKDHVDNDETLTSLILLNRSIAPVSVFEKLWRRAQHRICADGAANWLYDELAAHKPLHHHDADVDISVDDFVSLLSTLCPPPQTPDAIVGDLDSIRPDVQQWYQHKQSVRIVCDESQYSTDFGKSLKYAYHLAEEAWHRRALEQKRLQNGSGHETGQQEDSGEVAGFVHNVVIRGSLAGRVDQGIGVLHELYRESKRFVHLTSTATVIDGHGEKDNKAVGVDAWEERKREADGPDSTDAALFMEQRRLWLVSEQAVSLCLPPGTNVLKGLYVRNLRHDDDQHHDHEQGDQADLANRRARRAVFAKHCGILPVFGAASITTTGLEYDVQDWHTEMGGRVSSSNHVVSETVTIQTDNWVLFTVALDPDFLSQ